ncbi:MAG: adenylate kinase [Bacteroidales bacterium]|jgi:adenylate kinase|nr:adenylate kinase [Bacteroidales bacterium]
MLNLIIFGPPGAGKGTQSENLVKKFSLAHVSTGDLLRKEMADATPLGKEVRDIISGGGLVSDEIVGKMIAEFIHNNKGASGILFDGYPRTIRQCEMLEKIFADQALHLTGVIGLEVEQEELMKRLLHRASIQNRADDTEEVICARFKEYEEKTAAVMEFYKKKNLFFPIVVDGTLEENIAKVEIFVKSLLKRQAHA